MNEGHIPRLSVGLPVFNGECFIEQTIDSILDQSYRDFELVISDNCSTDRTREICEAYAQHDARIRYHRNSSNIGGPGNYNTVFRLSRGELFKWASSSDICGPDLFAKCIAALDSDPGAVLAFPKTRLFETSIETYTDYDDRMNLSQTSATARMNALLENLRLNNVMNGVIRRSVLLRTKLHRSFLSSDGILLAELLLRGRFTPVDGVYFYRRMTPEATVNLRSEDGLLQFWAPGRRTALRFQHWQYLIALAESVLRAHPGVKETTLATLSVMRRFVWKRRELLHELFEFGSLQSRVRAP